MIQLIPLLFIGIVILLLISLFIVLKRSYATYKTLFLGILGWLLFTGLLAKTGVLMNFNTYPPAMAIIIVPIIILLLYITRSKHILALCQTTSHAFLVYIQSFRMIMEVILYVLASQHIIPEIMTWNGRNIDILIGLTAPFIGYYCCHKKIGSPLIIRVWNYLGIILLLNVFIHGLLSAPFPFQVFMVTPANTFVATWPYVWLPGFVVPCALFFHILALRKK